MATITKPHMGQTLKELLAQQGMSQSELARRAKMFNQQVSQLCQTETWHARTVKKIANALRVPVSVFFV